MKVLWFVCRVALRNWGWVLGSSSTLCAGPSFSKHLGGNGLVAAQFDSWPHPPFQASIPQDYLFLMSLNEAKRNLGFR